MGRARHVTRRRLLAGLGATAALGLAGVTRWGLSDGSTRPPRPPAGPVDPVPSGITPEIVPSTPQPGRPGLPASTPDPTPTPRPSTVADLLVPIDDALEVGEFPSRQGVADVPWAAGICFMDTDTGDVTAYRLREPRSFTTQWRVSPGGEWLVAITNNAEHVLVQRATRHAYRFDARDIHPVAWPPGRIVVASQQNGRLEASEYRIVTAAGFEETGRLQFDSPVSILGTTRDGQRLLFLERRDDSPVLRAADPDSGAAEDLFMAPTVAGFRAFLTLESGRRLALRVRYSPLDPTTNGAARTPDALFVELDADTGRVVSRTSGPAMSGWPSRGGRFAIRQVDLRNVAFIGEGGDGDRWSTQVLSRDGVDVARLRSIDTRYGDSLLSERWAADGSGFYALTSAFGPGSAGGAYGYVFVEPRVDGSVDVTRIGLPPVERPRWFEQVTLRGPIPAPDNPDLASFGRVELWNRRTGRWLRARINDSGPAHLDPWAAGTSREMVFELGHGGHGGGHTPALLPPVIERPPFDDAMRMRVATGGDCLNMREKPDRNAPGVFCLADGELVSLSDGVPQFPGGPKHASATTADGLWVHVRTADGTEGWVSGNYLAWAVGTPL